MSLTVNAPSKVAFDLAPSGSSAWVFRVREIVAPAYTLVQGTSLPIAGSMGRGRITDRTPAIECTATSVPTATKLPYLTQQPTKGAFTGIHPGDRFWSPPD
ncbi:MAG TPA: hypothetical protein VKG85_10450 [Actinomycetes bacterium]|nr:hypothetical protein [Actinomycetes bacterium]